MWHVDIVLTLGGGRKGWGKTRYWGFFFYRTCLSKGTFPEDSTLKRTGFAVGFYEKMWVIVNQLRHSSIQEIKTDFKSKIIQQPQKRERTNMLHIYRIYLFFWMLSAAFKQLLCSGRSNMSSKRSANMKLKCVLMCWNRKLIPLKALYLLKCCVTCG